MLLLPGASRAGFVRVIAVILLLGFAAWVFLGNYELLFNSHAFMTGADYVDAEGHASFALAPDRRVALAALPLVWTARYKKAIVLVVGFFILAIGCAGHRSRRLCAAE